MSENFVLQLSVKLDAQHLINVRADDAVTFSGLLSWATEHADEIKAAATALEGTKAAPAVYAPPAEARYPRQAPSAPAGEIGPVKIVAVDVATTNKAGEVMNSPKYTVRFANGKKHGTFNGLTGQAAQTLQGQDVFYTVKVNGAYENLESIRRAG